MLISGLMPNTRSAEKRTRADAKRRLRNLEAKSKLKTLVRQLNQSVEEKKTDQAKKIYPQVARLLDQAAKIGIMHRNTVSRRKSRLARRLAKLG